MENKLSRTSGKFRVKFRKMQRKKIEKDLIRGLKATDKKSWLWEFSKKILFMMTVLYCIERGYAMMFMAYTMNTDYLGTFLETGADVFKAGVVFYALKAGIENAIKIKFKNNEDISQVEPDGEEQEEYYD